MTVPESWNKFTDPNAADDFQLSDGMSGTIITLGKNEAVKNVPLEKINESLEAFGVKQGGTIKSTTKMTFAGFDAYEIVTDFPDYNGGSLMMAYSFYDEKGLYHVVSIEGKYENIDEAKAFLVDSYHL